MLLKEDFARRHKKSPSQERRSSGYFIRWQERVVFSVQKETRDLLRTLRKKRERSERALKILGEIPSKRNILYDIIMRCDLEKVDVALLQSSFE